MAWALVPVIGALLVLYLTTVSDQLGSLGGDNARYLLLADAIRSGQGYVEIDRPGQPRHTLYPPVLPLLLAPVRALDPHGYRLAHLLMVAAAVASLLAVYFLFRPTLGPAWALLAVVLFGLLPVTARRLLPILSELPFLAFTLWSLVFWDRHVRGNGRVGWSLILAGLFAALAFLTRTAGLVLIVALVGGALLRWPLSVIRPARFLREGLALFILVALLVPVVAGWAYWTRQEGVSTTGYVSQLLLRDPYQPDLGQVDAHALTGRVLERLATYGEQIPAVFMEGFQLGTTARRAGGLLLGILIALGVVRLVARPRLWMAYLALSAGMVLLWPWKGERFLLPVLPLLVGLFLVGCRSLGRGLAWFAPRPVAGLVALAPAVVLLVGVIPGWVQFYRVSRTDLQYHAPVPYWTSLDFSTFLDAHIWMQRGLNQAQLSLRAWGDYIAMGEHLAGQDPRAVVACRKPRLTALTAGIQAAGLPGPASPEKWLEQIRQNRVRYVMSLKGCFGPDPAQRALDAMREKYPERVQVQATLPNVELLRIVDPASGGP